MTRMITQSLQARVNENEGEDDAESGDRGPHPSDMSLEEKLGLWARKADDVALEPEPVLEISPDEEAFEADSADEIDLNNLYRYQSLIVESPAFEWLLGSLQRELRLDDFAVDAMTDIRERILCGLPPAREISRKQAVPTVQVIFRVRWDPVSFFQEQGYGPDLQGVLGQVITLTGSSTDVQAATSEEYLCQTWPTTGKHMLRILDDTIANQAKSNGSGANRRKCK